MCLLQRAKQCLMRNESADGSEKANISRFFSAKSYNNNSSAHLQIQGIQMKLTVITLDVSEPDVYDTKSINLLSLTLNRMIEMVSAVSLLGHMTIILFTKKFGLISSFLYRPEIFPKALFTIAS